MNWKFRSTNIETKDFRWSTSLNLGHNANKIPEVGRRFETSNQRNIYS